MSSGTGSAIEAIAMSSGQRLLDASLAHVSVMAAYAGALIAAGALFSVLLSAGVEMQGPRQFPPKEVVGALTRDLVEWPVNFADAQRLAAESSMCFEL